MIEAVQGDRHGVIHRVVVTYRDRLIRFGFGYLVRYSKSHGASITVLKQAATRSMHEEYFLDQGQLAGPRGDWFSGPPDPVHSIPNLKRKRVSLQKEAYRKKSRADRYRNKHPGTFKKHHKYFTLRREWKRAWMKIRNIHEELAKQVATRFVAACEHEGVQVIRLEDLSWSRCLSRKNSGLFLATWQVHWLYSELQAHVTSMARREGMFVELVNPRNTSQKCSQCRTIDERKGKTFHCTNFECGLVLDRDLNATRNIHVAPLSAGATRSRDGCRYHPSS
ncbi:IS200/IS605 family element transposase accessory protein TnpB [Candidatus Bathyarchaeota archaeon]|nr:IS200/IS605 family element transposase accessory protein TnpB [Candidatus Bathyarchaeota archaeon]